jgi:hypothetical protein
MFQFALIALSFLMLAAPTTAKEPVISPVISIELNKLEANGATCRAYMVLRNETSAAFKALKLDLVLFDDQGVVARRLALQAAPLTVGKTSLRVFDIPNQPCAKIGRVLLNDILECQGDTGLRDNCMALSKTSSRTGAPFIK